MSPMQQKITFSASREIPFNKLMLSQSNMRHIKWCTPTHKTKRLFQRKRLRVRDRCGPNEWHVQGNRFFFSNRNVPEDAARWVPTPVKDCRHDGLVGDQKIRVNVGASSSMFE
ncbi:hypothetical protein [Sedimentitalea arenosa]|uniref:Uncharacterized protein n=1 Tax=Sedimentitalea arenosa TaxID=2798803 RepID=A0A8J7LQD3_9RHOB|nr:hypothetical protein [Arenibacterium arenosum]MBJ6370648.1 hypothetical protein [Arenibacterium arenosum]